MSSHDRLRDALRNRADQLGHTSPLTLDDVKGRARGIRRRRVAVSVLAAAAIVAVAVPAGVAVTGEAGGRPDSGPAASGTPTPSPSRTPDSSPSPRAPYEVSLTTVTEGHGGEPQVPYIFHGVINRPDGSTVPVHADYVDLAPLGDGWAATRTDDQGNAFVDVLSADGVVTGSYASTGSLAVSADGSVVSYATPDGRLMVLTPGSAPRPLVDPSALPGGPLTPVAVNGSGSCTENAANGGCTVLLDGSDGAPGAYSASGDGTVTKLPQLRTVGGLSPDGAVSGTVSYTDSGSCSAVLEQDGTTAWKTCDYTLSSFSPDGRYVVGRPAYIDGFGDPSIAILDARTGAPLAVYRNSSDHQASVYDFTWDRDETVLASVYEGGSWSFMRMSADGQLTTLVGGLDDPQEHPPVVLTTRP